MGTVESIRQSVIKCSESVTDCRVFDQGYGLGVIHVEVFIDGTTPFDMGDVDRIAEAIYMNRPTCIATCGENTGYYKDKVAGVVSEEHFSLFVDASSEMAGVGLGVVDDSYPHECPVCGGPAYSGFSNIECKNGCYDE